MKEARTKLTDSVSVPSTHEQHYKEKDTMLIFLWKLRGVSHLHYSYAGITCCKKNCPISPINIKSAL